MEGKAEEGHNEPGKETRKLNSKRPLQMMNPVIFVKAKLEGREY